MPSLIGVSCSPDLSGGQVLKIPIGPDGGIMSSGSVDKTIDDIIDLTEVVSVGSGFDSKKNAAKSEDAVLDSLVTELEEPTPHVQKDDGALNLSNLNNLLNSYNLKLDENSVNETPEESKELDSDFDSILSDIKSGMQAEEETSADVSDGLENSFADDILSDSVPAPDLSPDPLTQDSLADDMTFDAALDNSLDLDNNIFDKELDGLSAGSSSASSLDLPKTDTLDFGDNAGADEIDLLTADIINGTDDKPAPQDDAFNMDDFSAHDGEDVFSEKAGGNMHDIMPQLDDEIDALQQAAPEPAEPVPAEQPAAPQKTAVPEKPQKKAAPVQSDSHDGLKSDMAADEAEEISDEAFSSILNELSLEHEGDEDIVSFGQNESEKAKPIHLKGDISFIESASAPKEASEDVHLVQSASKVLDSDEAYLEKFKGEDESVGAKLKNLTSNLKALEQKLVVSDSKWQESNLEINYRISGLETRLFALEESSKNEITNLKGNFTRYSQALSDLSANSKKADGQEEENKAILQKIEALEAKTADFEAGLAEQKDNADSMQAGNAAVSQAVSELENRLSALSENAETEFAGLKSQMQESAQTEAELAEQKEISTRLQESNEQLLQKVEALESKAAVLESELSEQKAQYGAAAESNSAAVQAVGELESRLTGLQEDLEVRLATVKTNIEECAHALENMSAQPQAPAEEDGKTEQVLHKLEALESRIATLDDIFSEQKMLNDELSKSFDSQCENSSKVDGEIQALQNQIAQLTEALTAANEKISLLETKLEKAATLAAAKVLREEIIPLLTK